MPGIDSLDDLICNIKELMKNYFYPTEDVDNLINTHKHEISDVNTLQSELNGKAESNHTHPIDSELSINSINPVQNKVIKDALDDKAEVNHSHPIDSALSSTSTNPLQNKAINTALNSKANSSHNHSNASDSTNGFMSSVMFAKLRDIEEKANKTIVDSALSSTSTNPLQNKAINTALNNKADKAVVTTTNNGLMSSTDKSKLDGITTGARAKKRVLGYYIYSDIDQTNQPLIHIQQGTRLKIRLYTSEEYTGGPIDSSTPGISFPPQLSISYAIHGVVHTLSTSDSPASIGINLEKGEHLLHLSFLGSGNFYPVYRTVLLIVE